MGETESHVPPRQTLPIRHEPADKQPRPSQTLPVLDKSKRFRKGKLLGEGSFGRVFECLEVETGQVRAVKEITLAAKTLERARVELRAIKNEISLLRKLNHPNIIKYYEFEIDEATKCPVLTSRINHNGEGRRRQPLQPTKKTGQIRLASSLFLLQAAALG